MHLNSSFILDNWQKGEGKKDINVLKLRDNKII